MFSLFAEIERDLGADKGLLNRVRIVECLHQIWYNKSVNQTVVLLPRTRTHEDLPCDAGCTGKETRYKNQSKEIQSRNKFLYSDTPMFIGYARVSTPDQKLDLQKDALTKAGCEKVYIDKATGGNTQRKGLQQALDVLRPGDTLVVWTLDRLGRSLKDLVELVAQLGEKNIGFKCLNGEIDTTTSQLRTHLDFPSEQSSKS